jgi:hypothetical protein
MKIKGRNPYYRANCKVCISVKTKARRLVDGDRMKEVSRKNRNKYKDSPKHKERKKQYYLKNKEAYNKRQALYRQDPIQRMKESLRTRIKSSIKAVGEDKYRSTLEFIGCTWQELKIHLDSTFEANYGMPREYITEFNLHIDHIIPVSFAKISKSTKLNWEVV